MWRTATSAETYRVNLGEGAHVDVRLAEHGDTTARIAAPLVARWPEWRAGYPSAGYRILAADRLWSTIRLFYPYKSLIGENWDDQFRAALVAAEGARDSLEFEKAIAAFAAHIHDTHVTVSGAALRDFFGAAPIGAEARFVENHLVITRIADSSASRAGVRLGDVVVSVDGEPIEHRIARLTPYFAASTTQAMRYRLETFLLRGSDESSARLVVRGATGGDRSVAVPRSARFVQLLQKRRVGNIIRIFPGNVGYVDLDRLPVEMVDSAFTVLAHTKAIVLDDRGYPLETAWSIAQRLNVHGTGTTAAKFKQLIVPSPDTARTTAHEFEQPIPPALGDAPYTGRTVMLIDERTISQAEQIGLFVEAANGTTFIGSGTMGANGDITGVMIPGGIGITFTGLGVRHADGRRLQRVGLQPRVAVAPTIAGIRAGRDEVLETAIKYVGGTGEIPPDVVTKAPVVTLAAEPMARGWSFAGMPSDFRIGSDLSVAHSGAASGHVTSRTASPTGFGGLAQLIRADNYRGKRVRFSAYVKTRGSSRSGLWMRVDGKGGTLAFDNMQARPIVGTTDWTLASIVLDVPATAEGIAFGMLLTSGGEAWFDDASLEVVGNDVPVTAPTPELSHSSTVEEQRQMYEGAPLSPVNLGFEPGGA